MRLALAAALLALPATTLAQEAAEPVTPASVVAAAPASAWKPIDPADLLVMELAPDAAGKPRRVIIQLMPPPFSQGWVENIRTLARAHWWDGTSVYRVVDNWVAQWGDVDETKPLPEGVSEVADGPYSTASVAGDEDTIVLWHPRTYLDDAYSDWPWFVDGWPVAYRIEDQTRTLSSWPTHCYGSVGVARSVGSGGTGSELYAVIGHAPRQLDRNIAVVGRVIEGIEHLSVLPRGTGEAGVYEKPEERTPILSARLGSEMSDPPRFEYLNTESPSFGDYVHIRANRQDSFYKVPAGGIDVCNVQVPIRRVPAE
jgi:peptidylprolyl isomerase